MKKPPRWRLFDRMERARRFERPTLTLARLCSTPELRPLPFGERGFTKACVGAQVENAGLFEKIQFGAAAGGRSGRSPNPA